MAGGSNFLVFAVPGCVPKPLRRALAGRLAVAHVLSRSSTSWRSLGRLIRSLVRLFRGRLRNDLLGLLALHYRRDPSRCAVSNDPDWIVFEMRVAFGRARLAMAENLADEKEVIPSPGLS